MSADAGLEHLLLDLLSAVVAIGAILAAARFLSGYGDAPRPAATEIWDPRGTDANG
jgi:hypothetical protein